MTNIMFSNENYSVRWTCDECLQEDNSTYGAGYVVVNNNTGIIEVTSMVLPNAIWTAKSLTQMLEDVLEPDPAEQLALIDEEDGPVIN